MDTFELTPATAGAIERSHAGHIRLVSRRGRNYSVVLTLGILCLLTVVTSTAWCKRTLPPCAP